MAKLSDYFDEKGTATTSKASTKEGNTGNPCEKIAGLVFKAQIDAHFTHLLQKDKTLALHTAMEKFYEAIDGAADDFIEMYMGLYSVTKLSTTGSSGIDNPVEYFTALYNAIDKARQPIKESFLQNEIDTIQGIIAHTLYRLKQITD